jgi:Bacterial SH3 domain
MNRLFAILLLGLCLIGLTPASAQTIEERRYKIQFGQGQTGVTYRDRITGYESVVYRLDLAKGQTLRVGLTPSNGANYFNVYGPGKGPGDQALANSELIGGPVTAINKVALPLTQAGTYTISVYLLRAAARLGETSSYTISVSASALAAQPPTGGGSTLPLLRVTGLTGTDMLNVRTGPSTTNPIVDRLKQGEVVRNKGCVTTTTGSRWCEVERTSGTGRGGWASASYLVATTGTAPTPPPGGDALVPGTNFNATGTLDCDLLAGALNLRCSFGVIRKGRGDAEVVIRLPGGNDRRIQFVAGKAVASNSSGPVTSQRRGDTTYVSVGALERYEVPDAVIYGG